MLNVNLQHIKIQFFFSPETVENIKFCPSLSAKRKADRNSNLFEGLSAFSFCKDARGSARDGGSPAKVGGLSKKFSQSI